MSDHLAVVVVGGRIAGCLTAIRLARQGREVRLLESGALPSDTLSTHFFRGDGLVRSLADVGVLDEVLATGAPPLWCEYFSVDGGDFALGPPQEPGTLGFCLSVRRRALDGILARRAREVGVDVREHTRVVDVVRDGDRVVGVVDREGERHLAEVVVGADGRRSTVARLVGAREEERHPAARAMYYRYAAGWVTQDPPGPEFLLHGDDFAYAFPSDEGLVCLAVSVPERSHHRQVSDAGTYLEDSFRRHPRTADRMSGIEWASEAFTGIPADSVWREACGQGWALVGDSGTSQDPWAGLGMDTAARQAEAFAEAFECGDWEQTYPLLRRQRTYDGFAATTRLAPDLRQILEGGG
jgi:flavin-dependent dehydrogenase